MVNVEASESFTQNSHPNRFTDVKSSDDHKPSLHRTSPLRADPAGSDRPAPAARTALPGLRHARLAAFRGWRPGYGRVREFERPRGPRRAAHVDRPAPDRQRPPARVLLLRDRHADPRLPGDRLDSSLRAARGRDDPDVVRLPARAGGDDLRLPRARHPRRNHARTVHELVARARLGAARVAAGENERSRSAFTCSASRRPFSCWRCCRRPASRSSPCC
jgi:hypothetical protein